MASTNLDSADLKGVAYGGLINEDVMQKIWDISKVPLPFTEMAGTEKSKNEYKEWTTDELAAPDATNAVIDGADVTGNDTVTGQRVGNHGQTSVKIVQVSQRAQGSDTIGRANELAYQVMRRQQELRRDVEVIALTNQASVADTGTVAGKAGGLPAWIETTASVGAAPGAVGGYNTSTGVVDARTVGVNRALTETMVRDAVEGVYNEGGNPTKMMSIPSIIRKFSEYMFSSSARVGTLMSDQGKSAEAATALGSVNVFVTDFGTLTMVPNRIQAKYQDSAASGTADTADVFIIDPSYVALSYLGGYRTEPLAKTGLADKRLMSVDWTLVVHTEKSHALIADIDPTLAVTLA